MEDFHGVKFNFMVTEIVHGMKEYFTHIPKIFLTFRTWTVKIGIA